MIFQKDSNWLERVADGLFIGVINFSQSAIKTSVKCDPLLVYYMYSNAFPREEHNESFYKSGEIWEKKIINEK